MLARMRRAWRVVRGEKRDQGMSTAEYAVGTVAAAAFAAVLYKILTSGAVTTAMQHMIERALSVRG